MQDRSLRAERPSDELEAPTAMPNRQVQQLSQLQFEIRENEPIRSGEDRYRAVELITSAR